mmetsp:Transcript_7970/g.23346  ORF Transcript_7970/g.23346 Transcript_7970/m.23346 type:complete len:353 (-) Transcript_7970:271-1329(-)
MSLAMLHVIAWAAAGSTAPRSASRVAQSRSTAASPPLIDIAPLVRSYENGDELDADTVARIRDACSDWGFFLIKGHGVPEELVERFYEQKRLFFALDKPTKARIHRTQDNSKGWYDNELTKNKVDWKEGFDIGAQDGDLDGVGLDGFNQWPDEGFGVPDFEPTCRAYYAETHRVALVLLAAMAQGLGMPADHFAGAFDRHTSYLRLNYYPVCPQPDEHQCIGPHTDAGALTVLSQSPVKSLQVLNGGEWYDVAPVEGTFVINTGDVMQVWSNGLYKAPVHRVIAQRDKVRYSSPYFLNPNYDCDYEPIPSCVTDERPARYRPINWGKFRMARFAGDYADVGAETQISDFEIR